MLRKCDYINTLLFTAYPGPFVPDVLQGALFVLAKPPFAEL